MRVLLQRGANPSRTKRAWLIGRTNAAYAAVAALPMGRRGERQSQRAAIYLPHLASLAHWLTDRTCTRAEARIEPLRCSITSTTVNERLTDCS